MGVFSTPVSGSGTPSNPVDPTNPKKPKGDGNSSKELEDRFLKLLIAQMRNQDPTNPMDNSQLTAQLAQISTLAGIEKLNTTVNAVAGRMDDNTALNASKLINKGVMVPGNRILVSTLKDEGEGDTPPNEPFKPEVKNPIGDVTPPKIEHPIVPPVKKDETEKNTYTTPLGFELDRDADSVVVTIVDANGKKMREQDMGAVKAGVSSFSWDATLDDNETIAPDGSYTFTVEAKADGQKIGVTPLSFSVVYGVIRNKDSDTVLLDLGIFGTVSITEVRQILE